MFEVEPYTNRIRASLYQDDSGEVPWVLPWAGPLLCSGPPWFVVSLIECFVERREKMKDAGEEVALLRGCPELCFFAYHTSLARADCIWPFPRFVLTCRYNDKISNVIGFCPPIQKFMY